MNKIIPQTIEDLAPYVPGRRIEDVERELGLTGIIKLASNENSLGASPRALEAVAGALASVNRYSDADSRTLKAALAQKYGYNPDTLVTGNGSSEFILVLCHTLLEPGLNAVMSRPSFTLYASNARAAGAEVREVALSSDYGHDLKSLAAEVDENTRLVFLDNPLNPTGAYLEPGEIMAFHRNLPDSAVLVLDEAYIDFARRPKADWRQSLETPGRLVVMRTFSKAYGLAGLRVAYALMDPSLARAVNKTRQPFNLNCLAEAAAVAALNDEDFLEQTLNSTWQSLDFFQTEFRKIGLRPYPTEANFLMASIGERSAGELFESLLHQGVIIRALSSFGLNHHLRVSAGLANEGEALMEALKKVW